MTRGKRYSFLKFLDDDVAATIRRQNHEFIDWTGAGP
jgi:hypothetical protein